jgi:hypothetical protein
MRAIHAVGFFVLCLVIAAPDARATNLVSGLCNVQGVAVFSTRVHLHCGAPISGITYFAQLSDDKNRANQTLGALLTAQATGATVMVRFDLDDTSGAASGCAAGDCRLINYIEVGVPAALVARVVPAIAAITVPEPPGAGLGLAAAASIVALARRRSSIVGTAS